MGAMALHDPPSAPDPHAGAYEVHGAPACTGDVLLLGPVSPLWHGADFCRPLLGLFAARRQRVHVLDPVAFLEDGEQDAEAVLGRLADHIGRHLPPLQLIGGYALGGTLALALAHRLPQTPRVLCLSGPGFVDTPLRAALETLLEPLRRNDLAQCLSLLAAQVAPRGSAPKATHTDAFADGHALVSCARMRRGFELLLRLDARTQLHRYPGRVLCLLGEHSQLATIDNLAIDPAADTRRQVCVVPASGMRILRDNETFTLTSLHEWLNDCEQEGPGTAG